MHLVRPNRIASAAIFVLLAGVALVHFGLQLHRQINQSSTRLEMDPRVDQVLRWMPANAESLTVISAPNVVFEQSIFQLLNHEETWQFLALNPLWNTYGSFHNGDVGLTINVTMREYWQTKRKAPLHCTTIFLRPDNELHRKIRHVLLEKADKKHMIAGFVVSEFYATLREDEKTRGPNLVAMPIDGVLVAANDRILLNDILRRLKDPHGRRVALPPELTEWRYVKHDEPYWGLGHFAPRGLTFNGLGASRTDPNLEGVTFNYSKTLRRAQFFYLSTHKDAKDLSKEFFAVQDRVFESKSTQLLLKPGVYQIEAQDHPTMDHNAAFARLPFNLYRISFYED